MIAFAYSYVHRIIKAAKLLRLIEEFHSFLSFPTTSDDDATHSVASRGLRVEKVLCIGEKKHE